MKIELTHLKKYFGTTRAVDDISFSFSGGQIFGFVGPNGAGKTTTMRILATLDEPSGGDAYIDGVSVVQYPERTRYLIGYMPDNLPAHRDISVHEYLDFFARAYSIKGEKRLRVVETIEEFTNLNRIRDKSLNTLSKGMKQRVSLARALVHDPPVLIMDEPAAGLDPRARIELRELLKALSAQGKAILISSHILTELAEICSGAVIIEHGHLLTAGTMDEITRQSESQHATKRAVTVRALEKTEELHKALLEMPHIETAKIIGKEVEIEVDGGDARCSEVLKNIIEKGYSICEFKQCKADLEQIFMNVTKGEVQ
jgi:ABC-2 type transport system ATP-binding protein